MTNTNRRAWVRAEGTHEIELKGRTYRNLVQFVRPCAKCGEAFGIFVSQAVADGKKSNNNFGLKNCELHRNSMVDRHEFERLRTSDVTMKAELTALYARNRELTERLARYELPAAMAAAEPPSNMGLPLKMPWE